MFPRPSSSNQHIRIGDPIMKLRRLFLAILLVLFALPAAAQDDGTNTVALNDFNFRVDPTIYSGVNINQFAGDPPDLEAPGGPEVKHTQFILYNQYPVPESIFDAPGAIRVYNTADFEGYEFPTMRLEQLQTLLDEQPDLSTYMDTTITDGNELPFMPVLPAGQVLRARAEYVDLPTVAGIRYVTIYRQDVSPFLGNEFFYTFQGISKFDGQYVTAIFRLNTDLFPSEYPQDFDYAVFSEQFPQYMADSVATLNAAAPEDFTPSLDALDSMIVSLSFGFPTTS